MDDVFIGGTRLDFSEHIARGMELLDERVPGWIDNINIAGLQLASEYSCILGQLAMTNLAAQIDEFRERAYGERAAGLGRHSYWSASELLELDSTDEAAWYGFNLSTDLIEDGDDSSLPQQEIDPMWELLTLQWGEAIEKRRAQDGTLGVTA